MSNTNDTKTVFSTREDKIIKSTLVLYDDNEYKLKLIDSLNFGCYPSANSVHSTFIDNHFEWKAAASVICKRTKIRRN